MTSGERKVFKVSDTLKKYLGNETVERVETCVENRSRKSP